MNRLAYLQQKISPFVIVTIACILYVVLFAILSEKMGLGVGSLSIIPVIAGSWYFGLRGGIILSLLSIPVNMVLLAVLGHSTFREFLGNPSVITGTLSLAVVAIIVGRMGTITRERGEALTKLEALEKNRQTYTKFLELLNEITGIALEADNLGSVLKVLVERVGKLFEADDCFFAFWNDTDKVTTPMAAYGSMSDIYPSLRFEPGEQTLAAAVMEAGRPLAILDLKNSSYLSPKVASLFHSHSMLGIPLIVQQHKLGSLYMGYNKARQFDQNEIIRGEIVARQIGLILTKSQLLEEAHRQVAELTALHDVAVASIEADSEDQLIEHVTNIIGQNLFLDNFGVMLLDENSEVLHAHSSYRFLSTEELHMLDISLGEGITGQVAKTGISQRIGNVRQVNSYLDVDKRTISELCVPIKLRERVLGVINAESIKGDAFSADDERLLVTLAGQLATAIEQLRKAQNERKWLDQLAHSNDLIYSIAQITTQIERALTTDEIIKTLGDELHNIGLTCIMALHNADQSLFTINYTSLEPQFLEIVEKGLGYPLVRYTFSRDKLNQALGAKQILHPTTISNPEVEIQILFDNAENLGVVRILHVIGVTPETEPLRMPLVFEENLLGILWLWGKSITRSDLPIMSIFARQIGISLERARLFQEVQGLALTDPLTGLHNRRSFFQAGKVEFSRAQRMDRPLACMMLDLDHFKQINDNYGHQCGDQILQEFAKRCKDSVREIDLVGRYGGEEIIILLPETDLIAALQIAERMCTSIAETSMKVSQEEISVTASIGVAAKDENTDQLETLIARADQAMYIAKHRGRNLVAISR
ncbi:MAG TPA: diguanylate cyclase [Anaerolineales bacterium]|nr:diguanylate cyclase [Anaerolineales bacterium]